MMSIKKITSNQKYTTIRITKETHNLLANRGTMNDDFDSVIRKLLHQKT